MKYKWDFHCRAFEPADAESVLELERRLYGPRHAITPDDLEHMHQAKQDFELRVGGLPGIPLGFACWTYLKGRAILLRMNVHPAWRRQGLATQLLEPLDISLLCGIVEELLALVPEKSTAMQLFLQSQGYTAVSIEECRLALFFHATAYRFSKRREPQRPPIRFGRNRIAKFLPLLGQARNAHKTEKGA